MYIYSFEKLDVWKLSKEIVKKIYSVTDTFPKEELYGLTNQLRRASVSISSNLAEGSSRLTAKDKAHFTTIAFSSSLEVINQLILAFELGLLSKQDYEDLREQFSELTNKLNALRKAQLLGNH